MKRILVVDDDQHIGNLLEEALAAEGYGVSRAYSGTEAQLLLERERPDLVLLDRGRLRAYDETDTPLRSPDGIDLVLVGGVPAVENGKITGERAGRMLRRGEE